MEMDDERIARLHGEDGSYHTAQVGPGDRERKKSKKRMDLNGFNLDLIWI